MGRLLLLVGSAEIVVDTEGVVVEIASGAVATAGDCVAVAGGGAVVIGWAAGVAADAGRCGGGRLEQASVEAQHVEMGRCSGFS